VTSGSIATERPDVSRSRAAARVGFGPAIRSEWVKFRSVRGWIIGMIVAGLLVLLTGVFLAGNGSIGCQNGPNSPALTGKACLPPVPIGPGGEAVSDSFYFVHQPLVGNGSITIRVTALTGIYTQGLAQVGQAPPPAHKGLEPWAKAGIIIKASTRPGSAYAAMMVTGSHGVRMQYDYTSDVAGLPGLASAASPRWLRLTRSGDTIAGYDSADGRHWALVGTAHLTGLSRAVQAGMFAATPPYNKATTSLFGGSDQGGPALATGSFDNLGLRGNWPAGAWSGVNIGTNKMTPRSPGGFRRAGSAFAVSGSGDIAPLAPGPLSPIPSTTVEEPLAGVFVGLIAVVVVAAMFFTVEYRRGRNHENAAICFQKPLGGSAVGQVGAPGKVSAELVRGREIQIELLPGFQIEGVGREDVPVEIAEQQRVDVQLRQAGRGHLLGDEGAIVILSEAICVRPIPPAPNRQCELIQCLIHPVLDATHRNVRLLALKLGKARHQHVLCDDHFDHSEHREEDRDERCDLPFDGH